MRDEEPSKSSDKCGVDIRGVWSWLSAESKEMEQQNRLAVGMKYLQGTFQGFHPATRPKSTERISQIVRFINGIPGIP